MTRYGEMISSTPQNEKARAEQVMNHAGGYVFQLDKWKRLERWLILGSEGGTYYASEGKLTRENIACLSDCLAEDGVRVIMRIVDISHRGLAPKNDQAIFALALAASDKNEKTRDAAMKALHLVCRTGTHLFSFVSDIMKFRKWGRSLCRTVASWYTNRTPESLALQAIKYQQRGGWSHRDLLRLSHPKTKDKQKDAVFRWITHGLEGISKENFRGTTQEKLKTGLALSEDSLPRLIVAYESARTANVKELCKIIRDFQLPRECVPTEHLNNPDVWSALIDADMGMTALIRNLNKMTAIGLVKPLSEETKKIITRLTSKEELKTARIHPMSILLAMGVYRQGHGEKGSLRWTPERSILDALDEAFYLAFESVIPTGKNHLLALDVSGSMTTALNGTSITAREASAALAMVTARSEKNWHIVGFCSGGAGYGGRWGGAPSVLRPIDVTPKMRLDEVVRSVEKLPMGGTDCALPMLYAARMNIDVDIFHVYTDNETWAGNIHPFQALRAYRDKSGRAAKLCVVGMTATDFSIADPNDAGMLDCVGFSANTPAIMADFARGGI